MGNPSANPDQCEDADEDGPWKGAAHRSNYGLRGARNFLWQIRFCLCGHRRRLRQRLRGRLVNLRGYWGGIHFFDRDDFLLRSRLAFLVNDGLDWFFNRFGDLLDDCLWWRADDR